MNEIITASSIKIKQDKADKNLNILMSSGIDICFDEFKEFESLILKAFEIQKKRKEK